MICEKNLQNLGEKEVDFIGPNISYTRKHENKKSSQSKSQQLNNVNSLQKIITIHSIGYHNWQNMIHVGMQNTYKPWSYFFKWMFLRDKLWKDKTDWFCCSNPPGNQALKHLKNNCALISAIQTVPDATSLDVCRCRSKNKSQQRKINTRGIASKWLISLLNEALGESYNCCTSCTSL